MANAFVKRSTEGAHKDLRRNLLDRIALQQYTIDIIPSSVAKNLR
jgi:hypothetical protein